MEFAYFLHMDNVKFYRGLTLLWEPLNCGSFMDKIYLRLHENVLEISLKNSLQERIWLF